MPEQHIVTCPQCRRSIVLRLDGKLRNHSSSSLLAFASSADYACPGGGKSPYDTKGSRT
jgi:hypothetical protein